MKKIFVLFLAFAVLALLPFEVFAASKDARLQDGAELLTSSEAEELKDMLDSISAELQFDIVIITVDSVGAKSVAAYASDAYYDGNFGYGESYSGVLLLISMEERDWYIHSEGADILPGADSLSDSFLDELSSGDYFDAFENFADEIEYQVESVGWDVEKEDQFDGYIGDIYDPDEEEDEDEDSFSFFGSFVVWLVVGFIASLITTSSMKSKLKSVESNNYARNYLRKNAFKLKNSRESFLYSNVTRVARPKNTNSSSRSGSRSSGVSRTRSSGRSSRGGGGKF